MLQHRDEISSSVKDKKLKFLGNQQLISEQDKIQRLIVRII